MIKKIYTLDQKFYGLQEAGSRGPLNSRLKLSHETKTPEVRLKNIADRVGELGLAI